MKTINFPSNLQPILAEYIWIDAFNNLRSKTRVFYGLNVIELDELPIWNYDGSSTGQASGNNSEVLLNPVNLYKDPFRERGVFVLCETYDKEMKPLATNYRNQANEIFEKTKQHHPWFGLEQEYVIYDFKTKLPLEWRDDQEKQGKYYCSIGGDRVFARKLVEQHLNMCLSIGLQMSGINAEVMPAQWEFQVGPVEGIEACDQLWISRYILQRLSEEYGMYISFKPKPMKGDWNGSGCHINYSTDETRVNGGLDTIYKMIEKLGEKHMESIQVYGDNQERLSGLHETSKIDNFTYGVSDRTASIRIPTTTYSQGCGYFEDRRPASNIDPYRALGKLVEITLL